MTARTSTVEEIVAAVAAWRYTYRTEEQLQRELAQALEKAGIGVQREVDLGPGHGRIDLLCGCIGIEVKVAGSRAMVLRQLVRYATSGRIDALILVTSRVRHDIPVDLTEVPITVVSTVLAGL